MINNKKKVLVILGTRPEAIKLAPVINYLIKGNVFEIIVCNTGQHKDLVFPVLDLFQIRTDFNLDAAIDNPDLTTLSSILVLSISKVIKESSPAITIVQGDTISAFYGAYVSFLSKIPVAHIEAGLRTNNIYHPFPEEVLRNLISKLTTLHFAPTKSAVTNLKMENINRNVFLVGNTVIDAFNYMRSEQNISIEQRVQIFSGIDFNKKLIIVTCHRRENADEVIRELCLALNVLAYKMHNAQIIFIMHKNPKLRSLTEKLIKVSEQLVILEPLEYNYFAYLLSKSFFVITDSGGIQEEAASIGLPVLVIREVTEREEGIESGVTKIIKSDKASIISEATNLLEDTITYKKMAKRTDAYGCGDASIKISKILEEYV